jgi:lysophospholipase L1-like esterase
MAAMNFWANSWQSFSNGLDMFVSVVRSARGDPDAWESSIKKFEAQDRKQMPPEGALVFIGSSSFTFWSTLERDMAPLPVINRGFGGARIPDVLHYVERIVLPYHPRAVVLFAGTNDISGPKPASARQVFDGYLAIVRCIQENLPDTIIYFVAITPTLARWKYWHIAAEANQLVYEHTLTDPRLCFIDLTEHLLGADGKPASSLYRLDRLHPNANGYLKWTAVIKPRLEADLSFDKS